MNTRRALPYLLAAAVIATVGAVVSGQNIEHSVRMSYEESSAIKRSMLPPGGRMSDFELDHCTPLCLGGSNDRSNLQLQPWPEADRKDDDERRLCRAVSRGSMTRDQAIRELAAKWPCHSGQGR